ncbi:MAG: response regulator, partial [Chloroflexi bacterium]|nr:response regulator [Chloroflexota bacterium]
ELEDRVRERTKEIGETNTHLKHELEERKKAEEALQSSEVRNRAILDAFPDLLFRMGTDGTLKDYIAPIEWLALLPDQWLDKRLQDVIPGEFSDLIMDAIRKVATEGRVQSIEYELPMPFPGEETRSWEGRIISSGEDEILAIVRDVTENKQARLALERDARERETLAAIGRIIASTLDKNEIYSRLAEELPKLISFDRISIMTADLESDTLTRVYVAGTEVPGWSVGGVLRISDSDIESAIQAKEGHLLERSTEGFSPGERRAQALASEAGLMSGIMIPLISNDQVIGNLNLRSKDPNAFTQKDLELAESVGAQMAGAMANAQLEAERRQTEEVLRMMQYSVDHASDSIFWIGPDGGFQFVNEAACETLGYSREELLDMKLSDINPNFTEADWPEQWERVKALGSNRLETTHLTKDGKAIPIELTVNYLEFNGQEFNFAYARDITNRRRLESQLIESQKMEAVGRLAGGVAHDFNNFLTPMMSYAYLATQTPNLDDRLREYLGEIQKAAEHAANVTNQLLSFSRRQLIEPKVVDMNEVMFNMDRMLRRLLGEDLEMVAIPYKEPMLVKVDPGQIEQVLVNLVVNARDALPDGGKIILTTYIADENDLRSSSLSEGEEVEYIVLSVKDDGIGMDEEVKSHIFEPFYTTKAADKGTGLGLSTCFGIVKQAGGDIEVDSAPGKGTNFRVFLPRIKPTAGPLDKALASTPLPRGTETILVVEDEVMVRNVAVYSLRDLGYEVYEAANGDEALRLLESPDAVSVDLVLTDIIMPLMGGVGLMERLAQISPNVPVVLTSGYADNESLPQGILQPTVDFLRKPFTPVDLAKKIRSVLDKES